MCSRLALSHSSSSVQPAAPLVDLGYGDHQSTSISNIHRKQRSFPTKEPMGGVQTEDESTMGEKLASLNAFDNGDARRYQKVGTSPCTNLASADSVNVLLKQALHADDRALLLECLKRRDEKVITNSVSLLNPSDVFKLLETFVSIKQSRGAELAFKLSSCLDLHYAGTVYDEDYKDDTIEPLIYEDQDTSEEEATENREVEEFGDASYFEGSDGLA